MEDEPLHTKTIHRVRVVVGDLDEQEDAELRLRVSRFVLITSILDMEEYLAEKDFGATRNKPPPSWRFRSSGNPSLQGLC